MSKDNPTPEEAVDIYKSARESGPPGIFEKMFVDVFTLGLLNPDLGKSEARIEAEDKIRTQAYIDRIRDGNGK